MAELRLKSQRFRKEREADWKRLEALMDTVEKRSARALTDEELLAVPVLYRATLSALSVARATSLDQALIEYLETLTARAYFFVYGARSTLGARLSAFFTREWPMAVKQVWREALVAAGFLILGIVIGFALVAQDPDWFYSIVGQAAQGRDPAASTEALRDTIYTEAGEGGLSYFATHLFTNNAQVSLLAFALGFAFGIPTLALLFANGAPLGALLALFFDRGLGYEFVGWLFIHGVTELFAVVLAGAAGLRIGWAVAFPGGRDRLDAAVAAGRTAGTVMGGVVVMMLVAGLLEGFGRQLINVDEIRYAIGGFTGLMWALYFYAPREGGAAHGQP